MPPLSWRRSEEADIRRPVVVQRGHARGHIAGIVQIGARIRGGGLKPSPFNVVIECLGRYADGANIIRRQHLPKRSKTPTEISFVARRTSISSEFLATERCGHRSQRPICIVLTIPRAVRPHRRRAHSTQTEHTIGGDLLTSAPAGSSASMTSPVKAPAEPLAYARIANVALGRVLHFPRPALSNSVGKSMLSWAPADPGSHAAAAGPHGAGGQCFEHGFR